MKLLAKLRAVPAWCWAVLLLAGAIALYALRVAERARRLAEVERARRLAEEAYRWEISRITAEARERRAQIAREHAGALSRYTDERLRIAQARTKGRAALADAWAAVFAP